YPANEKTRKDKVGYLDWFFIISVILSLSYLIVNASTIASRLSYIQPISTVGIIAGIVAGLLLLEATRRTIGNALVIIILFALAYLFFGHHLGGHFGHKEFSFMWSIDHLFFTTSGIFSVALGISATFIFMFV